MKICISANSGVFSQYPKELIVYCDNKLNKILDLANKNIIDIEDNINTVKIICKSYSRKNILYKLLFLLISIFSVIFGTNGNELLEYIYDDVIELNISKKDIFIKYTANGSTPFLLEDDKENIIRNCRQVENKIFNCWIFVVVIPIQVILLTVVIILILASKYICFNIIVLALLFGFEVYMFSKIRKVYSYVSNNK